MKLSKDILGTSTCYMDTETGTVWPVFDGKVPNGLRDVITDWLVENGSECFKDAMAGMEAADEDAAYDRKRVDGF